MTTPGNRSGKDASNKGNVRALRRRCGRAAGDRIIRLALLRTLRDLRFSVMARRPMSLPNCRRLFQRRLLGRGVYHPGALELLTSIIENTSRFATGRTSFGSNWFCH